MHQSFYVISQRFALDWIFRHFNLLLIDEAKWRLLCKLTSFISYCRMQLNRLLFFPCWLYPFRLFFWSVCLLNAQNSRWLRRLKWVLFMSSGSCFFSRPFLHISQRDCCCCVRGGRVIQLPFSRGCELSCVVRSRVRRVHEIRSMRFFLFASSIWRMSSLSWIRLHKSLQRWTPHLSR